MDYFDKPIRIRAHNLLCIQGFAGLGYSADFIKRMTDLVNLLKVAPDTPVQVVAEADFLCESCPHNYRGRCTINDPVDVPVPLEAPDQATLMDKRVLAWLDISINDVKLWGQILYKVGQTVNSAAMDFLCGECQWRKFDYCSIALDELHGKVAAGKLLFNGFSEK